jgi:hypothetical protein
MSASNAEREILEIGSAQVIALPVSEALSVSDAPSNLATDIPLAAGLPADDFNRHYRDCLQEKRQQWLQKLFTAWHFWLEPLGLGFFPGKLCADIFLSADVGLPTIIFMGGSSCLLLGPWMIRHRQRHNGHKRFHVYYSAAMERCIKPSAETTKA